MVQSLTNKTSTETQYIYDYTEKNPTVLSEIKNNGVTIDYAYGCDNKKTDVTVDTNILYKKTHETYSVSTDIIGSTRWAFDSIGNVCRPRRSAAVDSRQRGCGRGQPAFALRAGA